MSIQAPSACQPLLQEHISYRKNNNGEALVKWDLGNKNCKRTQSSEARPKKMKSTLTCLCLGLQRGKMGDHVESNGGGKGKKSLLKGSWFVTQSLLRKKILCIFGESKELISEILSLPLSPILGNPHTGEPSLKILVSAASCRGQSGSSIALLTPQDIE